MNKYVVNVVIVAFNRPKELKNLVNQLFTQKYPINKIFVIDNSSTDLVFKSIQSFDNVEYLKQSENIGSAGGFSYGIRLASNGSDFVWLFDDDIAIDENALFEIIRCKESTIDSEVLVYRSWYRNQNFASDGHVSEFPWRGTLISTIVIGSVGYPDSTYFLYGEDIDYSRRIIKSGHKIKIVFNAFMEDHGISDTNETFFFNKKISLYKSHIRLYYSLRNQLRLCLTYKSYFDIKEFGKMIFSVLFFAIIKGLIFNKNYFRVISFALYHGLTGIKGKQF